MSEVKEIKKEKVKHSKEIYGNLDNPIFISGIIETKKEKVKHNDEIYEKLKNSTSGVSGALFIDNHFVPRMSG